MKRQTRVNVKPDGELRHHPRSVNPDFEKRGPIRHLEVGDRVSASLYVKGGSGLYRQTHYGKIVSLATRKGGPVEILLQGETEPRTVPFSLVRLAPILEDSMPSTPPSEKPIPEIDDVCALARKLEESAKSGQPPVRLRAIVREIETAIGNLESTRRDLTMRVLRESKT